MGFRSLCVGVLERADMNSKAVGSHILSALLAWKGERQCSHKEGKSYLYTKRSYCGSSCHFISRFQPR